MAIAAPLWNAALLLALLVLAARSDFLTWRVPNQLVVAGLMAAFASRLLLEGRVGLSDTIEGALLAGGAVLPGWPMGWPGAGDVKPMAVAGARLGLYLGVMAVLFTLIAGCAIALAVAVRRRVPRQGPADDAAIGTPALARASGAVRVIPSAGIRFPFALAIVAGAMAALWSRV